MWRNHSARARHAGVGACRRGGRAVTGGAWARGRAGVGGRAGEAAPEALRQAVGGWCQSGWGRLLSVTNAVEAGTWRQGDSGWA